MRTRYVAVPKGRKTRAWDDDFDDWWRGPSSITILEEEQAPRPTGLLDHRGNELMAVTHRNPIGFHATIEDDE